MIIQMNHRFQHVFVVHIQIKDEEDVEHHVVQHVNYSIKTIRNLIFVHLAVDQRQSYFNNEYNSNHHLSPSSSYQRTRMLLKGVMIIVLYLILNTYLCI
jgi:hypothetical protein